MLWFIPTGETAVRESTVLWWVILVYFRKNRAWCWKTLSHSQSLNMYEGRYLFWYTVLMQHTNIGWGWVKGAWYLPVYFLESSWDSMIISRSKILKQKMSSQVTFMQPLDSVLTSIWEPLCRKLLGEFIKKLHKYFSFWG